MSVKKLISVLAPQFNRVDHIFEGLDLERTMVCVQPEGSTNWSLTFYKLENTELSGGKAGMRRVDMQFIKDQVWLKLKDARISVDDVLSRGIYHVEGIPIRKHVFVFEMQTFDFTNKLVLKSVKTTSGLESLSEIQ